jgi:murein DD-endopeptidase MepM/ murein hydrolase activator NlpD
MANRFFTLLIIPEKTSQVRRIVIPAWVMRGALVAIFFGVMISTVMILDYWYVMGEIGENKQLKIENRRLEQQVQVFKNKMTTLESTMDRVKTFATRLKVITNIEDRGNLVQSLNQKLPDASSNVGNLHSEPSRNGASAADIQGAATSFDEAADDPAMLQLQKEYDQMDTRFSELNYDALLVEQTLQDQYELLADQKAFLAALPTRKPVVGYFTSGFGVRTPPFGGKIRMHEGVDIANHAGTIVHATADGVVRFANVKTGYGNTVVIDHGYGLETLYGHARKLLVKPGMHVHRGDPIAEMGSTGRSTGPHCHYEVRIHGTPVDPLSYILEN